MSQIRISTVLEQAHAAVRAWLFAAQRSQGLDLSLDLVLLSVRPVGILRGQERVDVLEKVERPIGLVENGDSLVSNSFVSG